MLAAFKFGIVGGSPPGMFGKFALSDAIIGPSITAALAFNEAAPIALRLADTEAKSASFAEALADMDAFADTAADAFADALISADAAARAFIAPDGMATGGRAGGTAPCKAPKLALQTQGTRNSLMPGVEFGKIQTSITREKAGSPRSSFVASN